MPNKKPAPTQMRLQPDVLYIFTDGSVEPNPGSGGWGVLLIWNGFRRVFYGGAKDQTNNTMELEALLQGLRARVRDVPTKVFSDSQYAVNCVTKWGDGWEKHGWVKRDGEEIKNLRVIQHIRRLLKGSKLIEIHWLKGHAGNAFNEMADYLARRGRDIYGLGLTEYQGPVDLSELDSLMVHLKKEGDPPFEEGEEDLPFPVASFKPEQTNGTVAEEVEVADTLPVEIPSIEIILQDVKETRGLVRRAEEKLKALEKVLKEIVKK